jgi:hypothetical protein
VYHDIYNPVDNADVAYEAGDKTETEPFLQTLYVFKSVKKGYK